MSEQDECPHVAWFHGRVLSTCLQCGVTDFTQVLVVNNMLVPKRPPSTHLGLIPVLAWTALLGFVCVYVASYLAG